MAAKGKAKKTEATESKGFRPSNMEGLIETAELIGAKSVFVNEEGEFFWKEKTAEKVWVTNRKEQNLEPLKYEEVSIESLGGPAPAETTEPEGEKPEGEKEVTETTEPEGEKPEGEKAPEA